MRSAIFVWASLLLIGSVSISQGYPNDNDENQLNEFKARLESLIESSESSETKRDAWFHRAVMKRSQSCTSSCKPSCKSDELCLASGVCTCPGGAGNSPCPTQSDGLCEPADIAGVKPVISITFGEGSSKYSNDKPSKLGFNTKYPQVFSGQTQDGQFSIVNEVPQDFDAWLGGALDHTTHCASGNKKGYMMVVNAQPTAGGEVLNVKADKLCLGLRYQFTVYVANIVKSGSNIQEPNLKLEVRSTKGSKDVIATTSTGAVAEQKPLLWVKYGVSFIATTESVEVSLTSTVRGGSGDDFALDDITLVSCSPKNDGVCK